MSEQQTDYTFIDYIYVLVKHRKFLIVNVIVVFIIASIYALLMPKTYSSSSVIMPPSGSEGLFNQIPTNLPIGNLRGMLGTGIGGGGGINDYMAILNSRNLATKTIHHFNLSERYGGNTFDDILYTFNQNTEVSLNEEGTVTITVETSTDFLHDDQDELETRKLCADIANFMVAQLDSINTSLKTKQAQYNREFIERRYNQNKKDLRNIENQLKEFEEKYGVISLPDQVSAAIQTAAQLKGKITETEIEIAALSSNLEETHPEIVQRKVTLMELRKRMHALKFGNSIQEKDIQIFPAFTDAPELGVKYLRLKRELEVQNLIYEFLTQQYEQAKLEEARDTPTVQVLDMAVTPIKRIKPSRKIFVILITMVGGILGIAYLLFRDYLSNLKSSHPEKYHKYHFILSGLNLFKRLPSNK